MFQAVQTKILLAIMGVLLTIAGYLSYTHTDQVERRTQYERDLAAIRARVQQTPMGLQPGSLQTKKWNQRP